LNKAIICGLV